VFVLEELTSQSSVLIRFLGTALNDALFKAKTKKPMDASFVM